MSVSWHSPSTPAVITLFELDRAAVLAGEPVWLHWRTENAGTLVVTTPDGMTAELDARAGHGTFRVTVTGTGAITGTAHGPRGATPTVTRPVAVFRPAEATAVPIPDLSRVGLRMAPRTPVPAVDRSGIVAALLARGPGARSIAVRPVEHLVERSVERPHRRAWLAPPAGLGVITPARPVPTTRPPRHLAPFGAGPAGRGLLRRLGTLIRRRSTR
ncbi:hypothetical protein [Goodfellowiella coeruleoviolacea]|uniref:Uncharacterized protein n=1 Tax=Goodfellowiella coeruleoviolacea TaxID=334858 RepID=A0AAE3KHW2_9PSEU|nr:hypothetical protein [Goodfellowiella coeruleoviolacea]MCP2167287.1 hypothetical protein [Goodfellowiella coeruleoviolacea]